jgi:hypothetical protein
MQSSTLPRKAGPLLHVDASDCWQQGAKRSGISFTLARARVLLSEMRVSEMRGLEIRADAVHQLSLSISDVADLGVSYATSPLAFGLARACLYPVSRVPCIFA